MAVAASSRSFLVGGAVLLILLWFLLQSSRLSNPTNPVNEPLGPDSQDAERVSGTVNDIGIAADLFRTEETFAELEWEDGPPTSLDGAPDNERYEAERKKRPVKPIQEPPPPQECSVCPEPPQSAIVPSPEQTATKVTKQEDRPLILYAYYESDFGRENLRFFVDHGLHTAADFVFIINGDSNVNETIIFKQGSEKPNYDRSNIMIKKRHNACFDLGAHAEVLNGVMGGPGWSNSYGPVASPNEPPLDGQKPGDKRPLRERYNRYILMNASIRGPFVPLWSTSCWSDAYLNKLTDIIKLVGMSYNCHTNQGHVQSMLWATDSVGLELILTPAGIDECFATMPAAQNGEIRTTQLLRDNGYDVDVFLSVYHSKDLETKKGLLRSGPSTDTALNTDSHEADSSDSSTNSPPPEYKEAEEEQEREREGPFDTSSPQKRQIEVSSPPPVVVDEPKNDHPNRTTMTTSSSSSVVPGDFWKSCTAEDWLGAGSYFGTFVHPYENLFMKSHRHIEDTVLARLTEWHDGWGYESYNVCF